MEENLLDEVRKHIDFKRTTKDSLDTSFFAQIGFIEKGLTHKEKIMLNVGDDFVNAWYKTINNDNITVVCHIKSKTSLIIPKPDEIHVHLITKNVKTNEEKEEKYIWEERSSPLIKDESL